MAIAVRLALSLLLACALAYLATPYAISIANRLGFHDLPSGYKGHKRPTPYLGGAPVMGAFVLALAIAAGHWNRTLPTIFGVAVLWVVGTVDDRRTVSPLVRVAIELALAGMLWSVGLHWRLHEGPLVDLAATALWTVAVINAFNLFDNMDGAASTMALVACLGTAVLGVAAAHVWVSVGAVALAGACLGFLPRNLSRPARIFLGDGGSMPVGFAVAVLAMRAAVVSTPGWQALLVGLLLVGVPALDTCLVIVSRRRRGLSVLTGGRDHLTHRTQAFLKSPLAVAMALGGLQAIVSATAVFASRGGTSFVTVAAIVYALGAGAAIMLFESRAGAELDAWAQAPEGERDASAQGAGSGRSAAVWLGESRAGDLLTALAGLGAGLSPFAFAYYDASVWVPVGLGVTALAAVGLIARPMRLGVPARLALVGTMGTGLWALASAGWAEAVESAVVYANRWLSYGAFLLLALTLARTPRRARLTLGAATVGIAIVAAVVLARLLGDSPNGVFLEARLNWPLGYINGEGCLFAIGFWLCFAAVESRTVLLAGLGAGGAVAMASLALLSQSRGTALAMAVPAVVLLAALPGRTRRAYGLIVVALALLAAGPALLRVYDQAHGGEVSLTAAHAAGRAALLASLAAAVFWSLLSAAWKRVSVRVGTRAELPARRAGAWALTVPVVLALATGLGSAHRMGQELESQWRAFTHLTAPAAGGTRGARPGQSRLLSGAGNRYDYWRIAWRAWKEHPFAGLGAGNYPRYYYQRRATAEDVEQPHSIELQALSELGLVGGGLLALLVVGAGWGARRTAKAAIGDRRSRCLAVAALGTFTAWLVQTSVDWMHLLPGLTALALIALAVIVMEAPSSPEAPTCRSATPVPSRRGRRLSTRRLSARRLSARRLRTRRLGMLAPAAAVAALAVAGASLTRQGLAQSLRARARHEVVGDPVKAVKDADSSLRIDADAIETYYVKAAAFARLGQAAQAQAALRAALAREPGNFVTWTLLGDIATREGDGAGARRDYGRARRLNPREGAL